MTRAWSTHALFSGDAASSSADLPWIDVRDYGAIAGGVVDCTAAFRLAALATPTGMIFIPAGTWLITDEVVYAGLRSHIRTAGKYATTILFMPTTHDKAAFRFSAGISVDYQCSMMGGFSIISSDTAWRKKGIRLDDVSEFICEDVAMYGIRDASHSSVGIEIRGREWVQVVRPSISADQPIQIKHNPNRPANDGTEDADIIKLEDFGLFPHSSRYAILVDGDARPTNMLITGSNDSNGGLGGFYWDNASVTGVGYSFKVDGLWRIEGTSGGYLFHFATTTGYRTLVLDGVSGGNGTSSADGFYVRGVTSVAFRNCSYVGTGIARNIRSILQLTFDNCLWLGGSTQDLTGLTEIMAIERSFDSTNPGWTHEWYTSAAFNGNFAAGSKIRVLGIYHDALAGSLTSGATADLPTFSGSFNRAMVRIHADGATQHEFIYGSYDRAGSYVSGSANVAAGNTPAKLCVHWSSPSSVVIRNNLAETVNFIAEVSLT